MFAMEFTRKLTFRFSKIKKLNEFFGLENLLQLMFVVKS